MERAVATRNGRLLKTNELAVIGSLTAKRSHALQRLSDAGQFQSTDASIPRSAWASVARYAPSTENKLNQWLS
jgi:hypothetical protein